MSASTVSVHTILGWTFKASERTAAHIQHTIDRLAVTHPKAKLVILQPCYNVGIAASAGTHDKDAVLDLEIAGLDWWAAQRFLRSLGWACWYRHTGMWANENAWHIHAISLGYVAPVGEYVPGQVDDYKAHAFGLAGLHRPGSDTSWFPPDIAATVFDYTGYLARQVAGQPTYLDITDALAKFAANTKNPAAKPIYLKARTIIGHLVSGSRRVHVPDTTAEVVAVLRARLKAAPLKAVWTRYRLSTAIRLLKPLA